MGKLFCKHNYIIQFAEGVEQRETEETNFGLLVRTKIKGGCMIFCSKCGKEKKHLAKKIGKYYAHTLGYNFVKSYENAIGDVQIHKIKNN